MDTRFPHVLFYDGLCGLCTASVQFILRNDRRGIFRFAAIQSALGRSFFGEQGLDPDAPATLLLLSKGRVFLRSSAALEIARILGFPWNLMFVFRAIPPRLRDKAYDFLAAHRYRWFGKRDSCLIPSAKTRHLFLS